MMQLARNHHDAVSDTSVLRDRSLQRVLRAPEALTAGGINNEIIRLKC